MTAPTPTPRHRLTSRAVRAAAWALRPSGPLTGEMVTVAEPDPEHVRRTLDIALRVAESMLSSGASANDTTDAALRLTRAYGVRGVHVDVTFTSISISWLRGAEEDPITVLRVVRSRGTDYSRIARLEAVVRGAEAGLTVEEARTRYTAAMRAPFTYRRWVVVVANGALAAGVCLLFAAAPVIALVAFCATAGIDLLQGAMLRNRLPPFFAQAAGAAIPTIAAVAVMAGVRHGVAGLENVRPSLVVASGIVLMLSGLSTVGAAQDAIDGFYVTAAARAFEVVLMTVGIITGILAVLQVADRVGLDLTVSTASPTMGSVPLQLLGAFVIAASFAIASGAGPRSAVVCSFMGLLGWAGYVGAGILGLGTIGSSAVGAVLSGFVATLLATRLRIPTLALTMSAVVPLMPGLMIFRGLLQLIVPESGETALGQGVITLLTAGSIGMALAAGVSLGTYMARPVRRRRTPQQLATPSA